MEFNVQYEVDNSTNYLRTYPVPKYKIGMSGGKDSLVAAALAVRAVGAENVVGYIMPNGSQQDLEDAIECCKVLGIEYHIINIGEIYSLLENTLDKATDTLKNRISETNDPACIRTLVLLAMTRRDGGVMLNTCNRCEDILGYSTFGGDSMGAVGVLCRYTVTEILEIGDYLKLPYHLVHKAPSDGMCGTTDELNLAKILNIPGFTYARLSALIRGEDSHGFSDDEIDRIINQYHKNKFKIEIIQVKHQDVDLFDYFDEVVDGNSIKPIEWQGCNLSSKYVPLESLQDISTLETKLYDYVNNHYYIPSDANYLNITSARLDYEEDSSEVWQVVLTISWGRYYEDDVRDLNEKHITEVEVDYDFITNIDYILGLFAAELRKI